MNALAILDGASRWLPPMPSAWACAGVKDGKVSRAKPPAASAQNVLREESDGAVIGPIVSPLVAGWQRAVTPQAHSEGGARHQDRRVALDVQECYAALSTAGWAARRLAARSEERRVGKEGRSR